MPRKPSCKKGHPRAPRAPEGECEGAKPPHKNSGGSGGAKPPQQKRGGLGGRSPPSQQKAKRGGLGGGAPMSPPQQKKYEASRLDFLHTTLAKPGFNQKAGPKKLDFSFHDCIYKLVLQRYVDCATDKKLCNTMGQEIFPSVAHYSRRYSAPITFTFYLF